MLAENRHVSATDYNEHSSRSHTIVQMVIESRERGGSSMQSPAPDATAAGGGGGHKTQVSYLVRAR